jgi:ABC-type thiamine transport system substrate-binding protein
MKKVVTVSVLRLLLIALLPVAGKNWLSGATRYTIRLRAGTTGEKINVVSQFEKENNCTVEWVQIPWAGMQDKVCGRLPWEKAKLM